MINLKMSPQISTMLINKSQFKTSVTPFSSAWGECGKNIPTEVVGTATLHEFDGTNYFFTTSCDPYIGHTPRPFYTFDLKSTKDGFEEKCMK
jgi:hypothetical protein